METDDKTCGRCGGPYWETIVDQGVDIHDLGDCIEYLKDKAKHTRSQTIRELDAKYNAYCEKKVNAAIHEMEHQLKNAEQTNNLNGESIMRGRAKNAKLEAVVRAARYCYRHGHIAASAVTFTGLDKHLSALGDESGSEENSKGVDESRY